MSFAIAHNGNITNVDELKELIPPSSLSTSMDTEYLVRILEKPESGDFEQDVIKMLTRIKGSFALGILTPSMIIAVRDPSGNRPLSIGKMNGGYCISSETCAFSNIGAEFVSDVEAGSLVVLGPFGITAIPFAKKNEKKCRFEAIYYSHPSSTVFGEPLTNFRIRLGRALEKHCPVPGGADIVTPIPDSSNFIAMGYGESGHSGTYFPVIIRNHYVGRTFIAATQTKRVAEVAQKFAFTDDEIFGKRVVVIDDSIVRGTTLPVIVGILRKLGAKEVHVRIGSPPIMHPCKYGINTPTKEELIAATQSPEQIRKGLGADSLEFLPIEALKELSPDPHSFCFACMNGEYW
jgi:amidophosphoribosyltransferase